VEAGLRPVSNIEDCDPATLLPLTVGLIKTPGLRDLVDSEPYYHTGNLKTLESVMGYYIGISELSREGKIRNVDPELNQVRIDTQDASRLSVFLRSLTEDYH